MKKILVLSAILSITSTLFAQTDADALRFSLPGFSGSSRTAAMGGAVTGLGGDISSVNINPAGLAQMGISEITFTGGLNFAGSKTSLLGNTRSDDKTSAFVNQVGIVWVPKKNYKNVKNISLAFNFNRQNNFNERFQSKGINNFSSFTDSYAELLNNNGATINQAQNDYPFGASLAYLAEIIDFYSFEENPQNNGFYSTLNLPLEQQISVNRSGGMNDISLGTGVAINDYFSVGFSLGLPSIRFEEDYQFKETDINDQTAEFNFWDKRDMLRIEGNGINAKFGVMAMPTKNLRLGASFTTPTRFAMTENYKTYLRSDFRTFTIDNFNKPSEGFFEYKLVTPWRLNAGASVIYEKWGIFTVDYELSNPGSTKFIFSDNDLNLTDFEQTLNDNMSSKYKAIHTVRAGVEGKIKDKYRARGGFQYRTSPFVEQDIQDDFAKNNQFTFSGGLGYRGKAFFIDAAYFHTLSDGLLVPYTVSFAESPLAQTKYSRGSVVVTVGLKL